MKYSICPKCSRTISNNNIKKHIESCNGVFFTGPHNPSKSKSSETEQERYIRLKKQLDRVRPNSKPGFIPWNKGLTKNTDKRVKQYGETFSKKYKNNEYKKYEISDEYREKCRQAQLTNPRRRLLRKPIYYNNIRLDSSYELKVAISLDENNIIWTRPDPFKYIDNNGNQHHYFPDFYLPQFNVYLDPKNDFLIQTQSEKIKLTEEQNKVKIIILNKHQLKWEIFKLLF